MTPIERLSLNQATTQNWSVKEAIEGCARNGLRHIGLWRHKVAEVGVEATTRLLQETGVKVSSLCRGGFFPASSAAEREARLEDNRRAVDEAAALGTEVLVLVCGGMVGYDLNGSRQMVADGIAALAPYAAERGINLGIEPLHPMFAADRSVVCSLGQGLDLVENLNSESVGVIVDVYHVWWDPEVEKQIGRASGRMLGFHINDWLVPPPDMLLGRGMMGDGVIELHRLYRAVETAGYQGPVEVEIFNQDLWNCLGDRVLREMRKRYELHVLNQRRSVAED